MPDNAPVLVQRHSGVYHQGRGACSWVQARPHRTAIIPLWVAVDWLALVPCDVCRPDAED